MAFLTIALLCIALTLVYNYYVNTYTYWKRRGVPYETPLPLLGNMKGVGTEIHFRDLYLRYYNLFKGKAPFAGMFMFIKRIAFIIDLDLAKQVLIKDFKNFPDRGAFNNVRDDPLTGNLFSLDGEEWKAMRHKLTPVFTSGKMKHMFSVVVDVGHRLTSTMGKYASDAAADDGDVEIKELCARYTTDVIGSCAFGLECNSLADANAEFRYQGRMIFEKSRYPKIMQAFIVTNANLARKLRFKGLPDDISKFFMDAVSSTVAHRLKNNIKRNDFLDQLIQLRAENQEEARRGNGIDLSKGLTIEQMAAQAFVFFVAGFETSSSTMAFCLYELAIQQDVQQRLRNEIERVLAELSNGEITYEAINKITYLDQVISETLRKHSIVAHLMRVAQEDYKVPDTQLVIEKGTTLLIPIYAIHRDPEIYPDPERFDPSRFEPEAIEARHPYAYMPFGEGPRNCIGERFGKMQAKIGLVSLLRHFKFSASKYTEVPLVLDPSSLPLSSKNGIHLKVERL
ncbi:probable cytochrome P450 6a14 [Drosophila sulfurigaster albostrigata]|uniref:probable cytochrome P450 6a14 n=1 Tax=Drosophila sulfurigaster albostrigata TaxID=89887 RepID=UPI002D21D4F4|nr:probable cytochrome P450 6a14 [Drosophila sulfurigaster albostrigata]